MQSIAVGLSARVSVAVAAAQTSVTTTTREIPHVATKQWKPDPVNTRQQLNHNASGSVPQPTSLLPLDGLFELKDADLLALNVAGAGPVFVEPTQTDATRYVIKDVIGSGTYGTVYRAVDVATQRIVAIKEVRRSAGCCTVSSCKMQQEIDVLEEMKDCPSVARILGCYNEDNKTYIVTELCEGGDLENFLKMNGPLNEKQAALVALEALRMLAVCHAKRIVHGDVKAANFVVSGEVAYQLFKGGANLMSSGWLKAIDFGTSQYTGRGRCTIKMGTPTHYAPEKFAENYGTEADIWSLGVMLYRLMTGRLPFWDNYQEARLKSEKDVMNGIIYSEPEFTSEPWCQVSPECVDFIKSLLDRNYATRLTAVSALTHPFIARHVKKQQKYGLGMFESVVLPSTNLETYPTPV